MISVVIPVYNQADKLEKCLESLKAQNYPYYEVIIVNDGSTDNIDKVIEKYERSFGFNFHYYQQENKGACSARNYGARVAKGEFILFCDADIVMKPEMLNTMKKTLRENPKVSYVYSSHKFGNKTFKLWPFDASKLKKIPYIHTTSLIRKKDFPGFDESLKRFQDWDLWLTMLEKGHIGYWIDDYLFKIHPGGTISNWLPSFVYKLMPFLPKVKAYKNATRIVLEKHNII